MSTRMEEEDWAHVLAVFRACLPRRGRKAENDGLFLEALHFFTVENVRWRAVVCDKGYASKANGEVARKRGIAPVSPHKANEKNRPAFAKTLYKARARIEHVFGRLKRFKRVALRCEKTERNFRSILSVVASLCLIQFVHTT